MSTNSVPLCDVREQYLQHQEEIDLAVSCALKKGNYVSGEEVELFEKEWAKYCGADYCVGVASGTDALYLSLKALGSITGVITTPFTFFATTQAIVAARAFPHFIDVNESGNVPDQDFRNAPAIPVSLYGRPGKWRGKWVIEDMAQAHGIKFNRRVKAACFSFYPTKNLGAMGQAGAVVTNDSDFADRVRNFRTYGERERFVHYQNTGNHRLDEIQAAILRVKLPHLEGWNKRRREIASLYREKLKDISEITLPDDHPHHVYHIFAIRVNSRDRLPLSKYLLWKGIQTAVRYPVPMHLQPAISYAEYKRGDFPVAESWSDTTLSLPMYPELSDGQVEYVCGEIKEFFKQ